MRGRFFVRQQGGRALVCPKYKSGGSWRPTTDSAGDPALKDLDFLDSVLLQFDETNG